MSVRDCFLILLAVILGGCETLPPRGEQALAYRAVLPGSVLVLNKAVDIPADRVSIYFQAGKVMRFNDVARYHPYCKFELFTMSEQARTVEPDRFVIKRVKYEEEIVAAGHPVYASLRGVLRDDGGPTAIIYLTEFFLSSARQPDVYRLTCGHWTDPRFGEHLTVAEVRHALGGLFTLVPATNR